MIDWTYNHFRVFMRILAPHALIYTEMQTIGAILHNPARALEHQTREYPLAMQLGGSDPQGLAHCAKLSEEAGFSEINLNLGCPSDKVIAGQFGACLMSNSKLVVSCIKAMKDSVQVPVTAKIRLGIDAQDSYEFFSEFALALVDAGADKIIVHARKAWLNGLSPKENRTIPPINYDFVYQLKQELGAYPLIINGNITSKQEVLHHLQCVDGVMLGRLACDNPYALVDIHHALYPEAKKLSRIQALEDYKNYMSEELSKGVSPGLLLKPILNLVYGLPEAKAWKRLLLSFMQTRNLQVIDDCIDRLIPLALS